MAKELYLYSAINDFSAQELISEMEDNRTDDIVIRMQTPGGSVFAGWGIAAKMIEHEGHVTIKVDGASMSMGALLLAFADTIEALDVSTFMLHRADMYVENAEDQALLDTVNKSVRLKLEAKINGEKLKELKGVSINDLFTAEKRIDLFLTAKEAKAIGLVDKINKVSPKEIAAYNQHYFGIAAEYKIETKSNKIMEITQLKAEYPALYNQILAQGAAEEKDRIEEALLFSNVDMNAVKEIIAAGKPMTQKQRTEFLLKAQNGAALQAIAAEAVTPIVTAEIKNDKTEKEQAVAAWEKEVDDELGKLIK